MEPITKENKWVSPETPKDEVTQQEQEQVELHSDNDYEAQKQQFEIKKQELEIEDLQRELQRKDEEIARLKQNTEQRKTFAKWVLGVVSGWVLWVVITTFVHACRYGLTEREICVLLGATAIVSLATTVLKGLFKSDET